MVLGKGGLGLAFSGSNGDEETWAEWISISRKSEQILEMSLEEWIDRALKKG